MKERLQKGLRTAGIMTCTCALLAALAGCGGDKTPTSSGTTSGSGTNNSSTTGNESSNKHEVQDLNGYTWSFLSLWGTEDSRFNPVEGHTPTDDAYLERNAQLMKDYNFKMEMKSQSLDTIDAAIMGAAMAGEKIADMIKTEYSRMQAMRVAEILNPIDSTTMPYVNKDDAKWQKSVFDASTFSGKTYGITDEHPIGTVCFFNTTLLDEKNMTNPYDLYDEGKWTWDEFEKLLKATTIDDNGDGTPDIYGLGTVNWATFHFETPLIYANGGDAVKFDENGTPRFAYTDNDAQEALEFVNRLYSEKVVYPDLPTDDTSCGTLFMDRKYAFVFEQFAFVNQIKDMEDDYGMLPFPKGPSAKNYEFMSAQLPMFVTTIGTPEADYGASSLIFDLLTEKLPETGDETIDDPLYNVRNNLLRDDKAVDIYLLMADHIRPCEPNVIPGLPGLATSAIFSCTQDNATTPKSAMESIADQAQALINEFYTKKN